jgi:SAM-dependent methyltransferase
LIFEYLKSNIPVNDNKFDSIYPQKLRRTSEFHFTPIQVAKISAQFLVSKPGTKVLDIGSGAGKFCMIGSICTDGYFVGIEQRKSLHMLSNRISKTYHLENIEFIHSNITEVDFKQFDAFYFYNSFYENINPLGKIDSAVDLNRKLYTDYSVYVRNQLDDMPIGTRLVTYFSYLKEIPDSYTLRSKKYDDKLKMWEKTI